MSQPGEGVAARGFDFFSTGELPAPQLPAREVAEIVRAAWGLDVELTPLGSQQDQNFLARLRGPADGATGGEPIGVVKVTNPAFSAVELDAQERAAARIASAASHLRVATTTTDAAGRPRSILADTSEGRRSIRLIAYLSGGTLTGGSHLSPTVVARLGELAARTSLALADFDHPGLDRVLQWDPRFAADVVELLARHHPDLAKRRLVTDAAAAGWAQLDAVASDLPQQAVHLDLTDDNVVCTAERGTRMPDGLIDFGDVTRTWAVAELAITVSSVLHHAGAEPVSVLPAIRAFHSLRPLSAAEVAAIWPLVVLRGAVLVVSGEHQVQLDGGDNAYAADGIDREWRIFEQASSVPAEVMTGVIAAALGVSAPATTPLATAPPLAAKAPGSPALPGFDATAAVRLDVSIGSDDVDAGAWLDPGLEDRLALAALDGGASAAWLERGTARLTESRIRSAVSSATIPTGIDVWFAEPQPLALADAPLVGARVAADGLVDGTAPARARIRLRVERAGAPAVPHLVRPEYAAGWLAMTLDPAPLLGLEAQQPPEASGSPAPSADALALLARRDRAFADVQEHYYEAPPRIERGWREHLIATDGRVYLDMVNNVTPLGHGHPKFAAAVARQLRTLNTNSRFNYGAVVEFSERLAATLPDPLDTVFLVNSGSEAIDLAVRIALAATGRRDVVSVREAYHGWTYAPDAVSTSIADNPGALATRPDWVHVVDAPNPFRGIHRGRDAARYAPGAAAAYTSAR